MKTMTVRDIRQRWPEAEKALAEEGEIIVTRDSKPVAKIVRYVAPLPKGSKAKTFSWEDHMRWLEKTSKSDPPDLPSSDEILHAMRNKGHYLPPEDEPVSRRKHPRKTSAR
jgi:antitoxin (DNA-binding transcriptional repressor) of toxin-antitoxin stability system